MGHVVDVLFTDAAELVGNESPAHGVVGGLVACIFHALIAGFALEEASDEALHFDDHTDEEPHLAPCEGLVIVVLLPANRTCPGRALLCRDSLE